MDVLLAVLRQRAHFIQLGGEAFADVLAVLDVARPVLIHRTVQKVKDRAMRRELAVQLLQKHRSCAGEELLHLRHHAKRRFEREKVFGRSRIRLDAGKNTLKVKDAGKHLFQTRKLRHMLRQLLDRRLAQHDAVHIRQRPLQRALQQARPHRCMRIVEKL